MALDRNRFDKMTALVIQKLEGGYYHPNMLADGRVKDQRYKNSGETMFGIDRKAGGALNTTPQGQAFWKVIDDANARNTWKWNYKGGSLAPQLEKLTADIMYPEYQKLSTKYLTPQTKAIVDNDDRLLFHFIYGAWNGAGWFAKFASDMNKAVGSGVTNPDQLVTVAINSRTKEGLKAGSAPNSLVKQGGEKIASFINSLKGYATSASNAIRETAEGATQNPILSIVILATLTVVIYLITNQTKTQLT